MTGMVTIDDCRAAGYCVLGVRRHCETIGIDFRQLVKVGIPLEVVDKIDDAAVQKIVVRAKERLKRNG